MDGVKVDPWVSRQLVPIGPDGGTVVATYGGHPRGVATHRWPRCAVCRSPMCHLAQIDAGPWLSIGAWKRMTIFICHATGGRCEDWDPNKGANRVLLHADLDDTLYDGPPTVRVYRRVRLGVEPSVDERAHYQAEKLRGLPSAEIWAGLRYDKLGGAAVWLQSDDTPQSPSGQGAMRHAAQITTEIVGFDITKGGVGWVFFDPYETGEHAARFLWQGA